MEKTSNAIVSSLAGLLKFPKIDAETPEGYLRRVSESTPIDTAFPFSFGRLRLTHKMFQVLGELSFRPRAAGAFADFVTQNFDALTPILMADADVRLPDGLIVVLWLPRSGIGNLNRWLGMMRRPRMLLSTTRDPEVVIAGFPFAAFLK